MTLFKQHNQLKALFNIENPKTAISDNIVCYTYDFHSDFYYYQAKPNTINNHIANMIINENGEHENRSFRYAVFAPQSSKKFKNCILLLHGLNERKWDKYLTWAHYLVKHTGKPVILFPLAFHMNRAPESWSNPRVMSQLVTFRKENHPLIQKSSFVNAALSLRMEKTPEMFAVSGIQSFFDIVKLALSIKSGKSPLFSEDCSINIFAYSIGALLSEVIFLSDPLNLFSFDKTFLFCGGSTFDKTNGISRSIMDNIAFENLIQYVTAHPDINNRITLPHYLVPLLEPTWIYFKSMINKNLHSDYRTTAFKNLSGQIMAVGLEKDLVFSGNSIKETLLCKSNNKNIDVSIFDFPYEYSHEKPFPMENYKIEQDVEKSFNDIFGLASNFLS